MTQVPRKFTLMDRAWTYLLDVVGLLFCGRCSGRRRDSTSRYLAQSCQEGRPERCVYTARSSMEGSFVLQVRGKAEVR